MALNQARAKARDATHLATIEQLQKALELYYDENVAYPIALVGFDNDTDVIYGRSCLDNVNFQTQATCTGKKVTQKIPADPSGSTVFCIVDASAPCNIVYFGNAGAYGLFFHLETDTELAAQGGWSINQNGVVTPH